MTFLWLGFEILCKEILSPHISNNYELYAVIIMIILKCNSVSFSQTRHIYDQRNDESSIIYIGKIISIKILISKIHENLSRERTQYSLRFFQNQFIFFVRHTQVTFGLNINQLYCEVMAMAHVCGLA